MLLTEQLTGRPGMVLVNFTLLGSYLFPRTEMEFRMPQPSHRSSWDIHSFTSASGQSKGLLHTQQEVHTVVGLSK